ILGVGAGSDNVRGLEFHLDLDIAFVGNHRLRVNHQTDVAILNAVKPAVEPAPEAAQPPCQRVSYGLSDALVVAGSGAARVQDVYPSAITELGSESDRHAAPDLGLVLPAVEHVDLGLVQQLRAAL